MRRNFPSSIIEDKIMSMYIEVSFDTDDNKELSTIFQDNQDKLEHYQNDLGGMAVGVELCNNRELHELLEPHWEFILEHEVVIDEY
jgi:hypothetical protein